jgi:hypothetical protein
MLTKNSNKKETRLTFMPILCIITAGLIFLGCGGGGGGGETVTDDTTPPPAPTFADVNVSWTANREAAVNNPGGGYRVYYSQTPNFNINNATVVDIPYASGSLAPTSIVIPQLTVGSNYYFKVVAYSSLNNSGSEPSQAVSIKVQ